MKRKGIIVASQLRSSDKLKIIDDGMDETLFRLWFSGRSFTDLQRTFAGTPKEFSLPTIYRHAKQKRWKKRRDKILKEIRGRFDTVIENFQFERISMAQDIITLLKDELNNYIKLLQDPNVSANDKKRARPGWMPSSSRDIDSLFRLHEFLISGGVDKSVVGVPIELGVNISDNIASKLLDQLAEDSTKKLIDSTTIEAQFEEVIEDNKEDGTKYPVKQDGSIVTEPTTED